MKKLITLAILSALALGANAKSFHANLICSGSNVQYDLSSQNQSSIIVDGVPYPIGKDSVSVPNMGGSDMVTMLRASNQAGHEAALSYTGQSLREGKLWLIVGSGPEKECRVLNSWEGN